MSKQSDNQPPQSICQVQYAGQVGYSLKADMPDYGGIRGSPYQDAFIQKALRSRERARVSGEYYSAEAVLQDLARRLEAAKTGSPTSDR